MFSTNSLLLYKNHPARLVRTGERLEIALEDGSLQRVRPKDVALLHPGPLQRFEDLRPEVGEVQAAWEILAGELTTLAELAELIYSRYTPSTAWAAWRQVAEGLYFEGGPEEIRARSAEEVARRAQEREHAETARSAKKDFLERVRTGRLAPEDREAFRDVEALALEKSQRAALLRELGRPETPESAHAFLLDLGIWEPSYNPYPARFGVDFPPNRLAVPELPEEARQDLTRLAAFAIDDEGSDTPDDAISMETTAQGWRLWVHVADLAAVAAPDGPLDLEARVRGESLHLPEGTIHMVPREATLRLGLGLQEQSPALSFGIDIDPDGSPRGFTVTPSWVRVTRMTYAAVETRMHEEPFAGMDRLLIAARARRAAQGAVLLDFPEVQIIAEDGQVAIRPLPPLRSREMVAEAMITAGIETARFAAEQGLPMAFSQQPALEPPAGESRPDAQPATLSAMFALRRLLKRSRYHAAPGPHSGLGAPAYVQVTSPLRRSLDLVNHQQLRAFLRGAPLLDESAVVERIGALEAVLGGLRQAEFLSEKHWTLVYLLQNPGWRGEGVLVDRRGMTGLVLVPSLALEARVHLRREQPLDSTLSLTVSGVDLPQRDVSLRILDD